MSKSKTEQTRRNTENVIIDATLPIKARIADYIRQIGNPYCYNYNRTTVTISFAGKTTIDACLSALINSQLPICTETPVMTAEIAKIPAKKEHVLPAA